MSFYMAIVSMICTLILCLATGQLCLPQTPGGWGVAFLFSFAVSVGAVVLFQEGTFLIGAQRAAILSTFEPITSIFFGILFSTKRSRRASCSARPSRCLRACSSP